MKEHRVKILVACHKPDTVYSDNVYIPIHVGRSISRFKEDMREMIGDDTGDNISEKNPYYCELTALYWAWKNLDADFVGLCHYRRYFESMVTNENILRLLNGKDALCIHPLVERKTMASRLVEATCMEDFQIFMSCIKIKQPRYYDAALKFVKGNKCIPFNMFVMRKGLFDDYCEWMFSILFEMEKYVRLSGYTRARRLYGYMAEMLLPIYFKVNNYTINYDECVPMVGLKHHREIIRPFRDIYNNIVMNFLFERTPINSDAVFAGFKADGIELGEI